MDPTWPHNVGHHANTWLGNTAHVAIGYHADPTNLTIGQTVGQEHYAIAIGNAVTPGQQQIGIGVNPFNARQERPAGLGPCDTVYGDLACSKLKIRGTDDTYRDLVTIIADLQRQIDELKYAPSKCDTLEEEYKQSE